MKHTKGPWKYDEYGCTIYSESEFENAEEFEDEQEGELKVVFNLFASCGDNSEANIALTTAAPDMLEALENLENDADQIPPHAWKLVKEAIKKAKG